MRSAHRLLSRMAPLGAALALFGLASAAQAAPTCSPSVKEEIARTIADAAQLSEQDRLKLEYELYVKYKYCAADGLQVPTTDPIHVAARQCGARITYLGSTFFEDMPCCGYDPQRRTFACPVGIKQGFGFGASPLPGSREYVLHCVQNPAGVFVPVGVDSVHLSNSVLPPRWQFAVVANANQNLQLVQPMNGQQRIARSILSWNMQPTGCNYQPIWGNVLEYKIRLDQ